jgi:hypothetical protein
VISKSANKENIHTYFIQYEQNESKRTKKSDTGDTKLPQQFSANMNPVSG